MAGRPRSAEAPLSKEQQQRPERKGRVSMANEVRNVTGLDPNYFYYEFDATKPGRIQQALDAGYEYVQNSEGANVFREKNGGKLVLMRIPNELREEDRKAGQEKVNDAIRAKVQSIDTQGPVQDYIPKTDDGRERQHVATLDMGI